MLVQHLTRCLRICAADDLSNAAVSAPTESLVEAVNAASRDGGTVAVQVVRGKFFLNKRFIRMDAPHSSRPGPCSRSSSG